MWQTSKIIKTQNEHPYMTDDVIKQVPQILENPIILMQSKSVGSRVTMFGEVYDRDGLPILAVLELEPNSRTNAVILNEIRLASTHSRKDINNPASSQQTQGFINSSKILYIDPNKKRTNNWLSRNRLQLPLRIKSYGSLNTISYDKTAVNSYNMQNAQQNAQPQKTAMELALENAQQKKNNSQHSLNPIDIAKMTKEQANTTPPFKRGKETEGNKRSRTADTMKKYTIFDHDFIELAENDKSITTYDDITNKETMEKANKALNNGGEDYVKKWKNKPRMESAEDIATGVILMSRYNKIGDYESMIAVMEKVRKSSTENAQTLQAMSLLSRLTPEGMTYYAQKTLSKAFEEMINGKTSAWISQNANKFKLTADDIDFIQRRTMQAAQLPQGRDKQILLGEISARIQNKIPPMPGQSAKALSRLSMLLNPKTHSRNILGNAVVIPQHAVSDFLGSGIDTLVSSKTGVRTTGMFKPSGKAILKGAYESFDDFRRGINTRDMGGDRFEIGKGLNFGDKTRLGKSLNTLDRVSNFLLDVGDRPFYEAWFVNSLNNQMKLNNATQPTAEMIDIATTEALERTWQDNNNYTNFVSFIRKSFNAINIKGYGLGDVIMPFVKTPANLTKALIEYSPFTLVKAAREGMLLKNAIERGTVTPAMQKSFVKSLSYGITGTIMYVIMGFLAQNGTLKGEGEKDKDLSAFMRNVMGEQPYSIKFGDKSYSYAWAQPVAGAAAITADVVNTLKTGNVKQVLAGDDNLTFLANSLISAIESGGNVLYDQSFMQGIKNLFAEDNMVKGFMESILGEPAKFTPQFLAQIAQIQDDTVRTTYAYGDPLQTAVNKVKAKVPGLSKTLEPVIDVFGRDVKRNGGENTGFNVFFNPANVAKEHRTPSADEAYRLYKSTGDTAVIPPAAPYYFQVDGEKYIMTLKQKSEYQRITGKIADEELTMLLENPVYNSLDDTDKVKLLTDIYSYSTAYAKSKVSPYALKGIDTKICKAQSFGVSPSEYLVIKQGMDTDDNGYVSKEETKTALNAAQLTYEQRKQLFMLQNAKWKNPY
ncbi:MAG: hypothetical protein RR263_00450 [Oscillospiraceae bacterium]